MTGFNIDKMTSFATAGDLGHWFKLNHAKTTELWIKVFKKHSKIKSVTWDDIVVESLCWGWIDSTKKSLDEQAYLQRISPRKERSIWSKRNIKHVERLIKEGRMTEHGLVHVNAAKADGRWENAYSVSEMTVPSDFIAALENNLVAKVFFEPLTKSSKYVIAHGLISAKKPETRQRRFTKFIDMLSKQEKPK